MRIVSSTEFRDNQALYLDQADNGEEILIQRGRTKSYKIIPVTEFDTVIGKEYILEPDADFERAITMDELLQGVKVGIHEIFTSEKRVG